MKNQIIIRDVKDFIFDNINIFNIFKIKVSKNIFFKYQSKQKISLIYY